jgi:Protein of unknown function (DUF3152)
VHSRASALPLAIAGVCFGVIALVTGAGPSDVRVVTEAATTAAASTPPPTSTTTTTPATTTTAPPSNVGAPSTGEFLAVAGSGPAVGAGAPVRYRVEVETGLTLDPAAFAGAVEASLADPRSWTGAGDVSLQRVDGEADVVIMLATPATTDRLCLPLQTNSVFSCHNGGRVILNVERWEQGSAEWPLPISEYRAYMVNHEFGHALGHGHVGCPAAGAPAPVMMQQTKSLDGCLPNAWPYP